MSQTISKTTALVRRLFEGVADLGGQPFAEHCIRVMNRLPADATEDEQHAALLHDVLEDTDWTADDLRALGYLESIIAIVEVVTLKEGMSYSEQIERLAMSGNRSAIRVKLADNTDNMDPERLARTGAHQARLERKYRRARAALELGLATSGGAG